MATLTQGKNETHLSKMTKTSHLLCTPHTYCNISYSSIPPSLLSYSNTTKRDKSPGFLIVTNLNTKYKNSLLKSSESKRQFHSISQLKKITVCCRMSCKSSKCFKLCHFQAEKQAFNSISVQYTSCILPRMASINCIVDVGGKVVITYD